MALLIKLTSFFLLSLLTFTLVEAVHLSIPRKSRARAFIEFQCKTTLYPDLCVRSLSYYVNNFTATPTHQRLAKIAVNVALLKGETTQAYINSVAKQLKQTKGKDYRSIQDCLNQINDGVNQLTNCIKENQEIKEGGATTTDFTWHASNMQTWLSTALTDTSACVDGFSGQAFGGKTKAMIKARVVNLEQQTSIALALFNRFAARYRSAHMNKP